MKFYRPFILLFISSFTYALANPVTPELPRSIPSSNQPPVTGSTITVHSTDNLQTKYNAASCGDILVLDAGSTWTGNFIFNKQCTDSAWFQIVSSSLSAIAITPVVTLSNANASLTVPPEPPAAPYAELLETNGVAALNTTSGGNVPGSHHYFGGINITTTHNTNFLAATTNADTESLASQLGDNFIFDRLWVHNDYVLNSTNSITRGFIISGSSIAIVNSWFSNLYGAHVEGQAIFMFAGPGPTLIKNNFLEGTGEITFQGGGGPPPFIQCSVLSSPAPNTTSATIGSCKDQSFATAPNPSTGTCFMVFKTSWSYTPMDYTCVTAVSGSSVTFNAIPDIPFISTYTIQFGALMNDITIVGNRYFRPPQWDPNSPGWDGIPRVCKDFAEMKQGFRWNFNGNIFQNDFNQGQNTSFNFNSANQTSHCSFCTSGDVTFTNNLIQNGPGDFVIIPAQSEQNQDLAPGFIKRILIKNNLWFPLIDTTGSTGTTIFELGNWIGHESLGGGGSDSVQIVHNTFVHAAYNMRLDNQHVHDYTNFLMRDNLTEFDQFRWADSCITGPDGTACMNSSLNQDGSYSIDHNGIINVGALNGGQGISDALVLGRYGSLIFSTIVDTYSAAGFANYSNVLSDYHNFGLTGASVFHNQASDGTDLGVNLTILDTNLFGSTSTLSGSFNGSPPSVANGQPATLSWTILNSTTVMIDNGIGTVSASGNQIINPAVATTYTLTAYGLPGSLVLTKTINVACNGIDCPFGICEPDKSCFLIPTGSFTTLQ